MKRTCILSLFLLGTLIKAQTDFKFDSVVYKTLYPKDLCAFLKDHPNAHLFDVRSPGEFADTSMYKRLNIGHLKGAVNVPIDSVEKRIPELKKYSSDPVILYCSHSQRSRRVSKLLKENGFTEVRNLNGGMTWMNQAEDAEFPCKKEMIIHALPYKTLPARETYELIRNNKDLVIVDVRPVTEFEGRDTSENLNIGRIKNAINIPYTGFKEQLPSLQKYKHKTILLYDSYGGDGNRAAEILAQEGFTKVHSIIGGLSALVGKDHETMALRKEAWTNMPTYNILNLKEALGLLQDPALVILDLRPLEEYNNQSKDPWRNLGRMKGATHIPPAELDKKMPELQKYKNSRILVYGSRDAAKCCKKLKEAGFVDVNLLYGGLWEVVSTSANVYGFKYIRSYLENNEGLY